jgi:type IV secretion system protein VirB1
MDATAFLLLASACAPAVDPTTARALVHVESAFNPHAIGIVSATLARQPQSAGEAIATGRKLQADGAKFSVGLAQINVHNFERLGLTVATAFEPCANLAAMQAVLLDCYRRASATGAAPQRALRQALSCYYSGNFTTGFEHGYTRRVVRAGIRAAVPAPSPLQFAKEAS